MTIAQKNTVASKHEESAIAHYILEEKREGD
jgi:hypothetical protein